MRAPASSGSSAGLTPGILRAPPCLWWDARSASSLAGHTIRRAFAEGTHHDHGPAQVLLHVPPGADQGTDHQPHPERAVRRHPEHPGRQHHRAGRPGGGRDRGLAGEDRPIGDLPARARRDGRGDPRGRLPRRVTARVQARSPKPLALAFLLAACAGLPRFDEGGSWPRPKSGMVVCEQPLATAAGVAILEKGGNAADAAVATALALAVVYPQAGNLGGGGFAVWVAHDPAAEPLFLDFRETAPAALRAEMFLDERGRFVQ